HGGRRAVLAIGRDVTERKQAERRFRQTEELHRQVEHAAKIGHWFWRPRAGDPDWRAGLSEYSEAAAAIFGVASAELAIPTRDFIERFVHPDDREHFSAQLEKSLPEQHVQREYRIVRPSGEVRAIAETSERLHDKDGRIVLASGIVQDITERTRMAAAL